MDFHETWIEDGSQPRADGILILVQIWIKGQIQSLFSHYLYDCETFLLISYGIMHVYTLKSGVFRWLVQFDADPNINPDLID